MELLVALLAEGVDRNTDVDAIEELVKVALLAEGVDRNIDEEGLYPSMVESPSSRRAWIEIRQRLQPQQGQRGSPSSRRAWIEISSNVSANRVICVALLAEGVDRNIRPPPIHQVAQKVALLAEGVDRNAEFERLPDGALVALLAEGVDRNFSCIVVREILLIGRPPRGGRG